MLRTHTCGELTEKNVGQEVTLCGWVDTKRDHGGLIFIDLRDRYGRTQLVLPLEAPVVHEGGFKSDDPAFIFKSEDCIRVTGKVQKRPKGTENLKLPTGLVEVLITGYKTLNSCNPLPFEVTKSHETNEELRLQYRYLDLRNPEVQKNIFVRHKICQVIRRTLDQHDFIEVETPILTKSTPEGARDYLVPSRVNQGEFYALPQSPQLFKQILMVSGFDRYFQIAKCFRDEDLRADRQPEFTQLDMEMSFLEENDLFSIVEHVLKDIFKEVKSISLKIPFPRLSYEEAAGRYGSDKPDLRFGLPIEDISSYFKQTEFKIFKEALAKKEGRILSLTLSKPGEVSRKDTDDLIAFAKAEGAGGLAFFKAEQNQWDSPIAKFFDSKLQSEVIQAMKISSGDLVLIVADEKEKARKVMGALRTHLAKLKKLVQKGEFHFSWVTDFPLFKWSEEEKRWESEHHPFTAPNEEDWKKYKDSNELGKIRARAYDLVLNGSEIASGSVRIHNEGRQKEIFKTIGLSEKEAESRFGFLLKAFKFGAPPHGGIALGLDRLAALILGLESIREVIAFPKNQKAVDPMTEAPSPVNEKQLKELGIKIR